MDYIRLWERMPTKEELKVNEKVAQSTSKVNQKGETTDQIKTYVRKRAALKMDSATSAASAEDRFRHYGY